MTDAEAQIGTVVEVPVYEVTAELRFPGDARIPAWRAQLQQRIRSDYPNLLVPHAKPGEAPAMQHFRFANEAGTRSVDVAIHSLAVMTREYPGWRSFRTDVLRYWGLLRDDLGVQRLTRIGLKYVNHFPGLPSLSTASRGIYGVFTDAARYHRSVTVLDTGDVQLILNLEIPEGGSPVTVDLDAFRQELQAQEVETVLERLHNVVEREFAAVAGAELASRLGIRQGG